MSTRYTPARPTAARDVDARESRMGGQGSARPPELSRRSIIGTIMSSSRQLLSGLKRLGKRPRRLAVLLALVLLGWFVCQRPFDVFNFLRNHSCYQFYDLNFLQPSPRGKFVLYQCTVPGACGGWADRLKGILSAYALSLLTGRRLVVNVKQPCELARLLEPNEVAWYHEDVERTFAGLRRENFSLSRNSEYCATADVVEYSQGKMLVNALQTHAKLESKIHELGFEPDKFRFHYLFREWYRKLFKLSPRLDVLYRRFLEQLKPPGKKRVKLVCAQVRTGGTTGLNKPDTYYTFVGNSQLFWSFINETIVPGFEPDEEYRVFVTADREEVKLEAKKYFGVDKVILYANTSFHIDKDKHNLGESECGDQIGSLLLEFHSFQECDVAVVSHSGFGVLGAWNRADPAKDLYVYTKSTEQLLERYWDRTNLSFQKITNLDEFYFL